MCPPGEFCCAGFRLVLYVLVCLKINYTAFVCSSLIFPFLFKDALSYGLQPPFINNGIYWYEDLGISLTLTSSFQSGSGEGA